MPTPRTVAKIKSSLLRPALTSHYEIEIPYQKLQDGNPKGLNPTEIWGSKVNSNTIEDLRLSCCETSLPGSSLATLEINNDYTGVTERHAHRRIYDDRIDFTFYVNAENYFPIWFFETWIKYIAGEAITPDTDMRGENVGAKNRNYFYRIRYPNTYIMDQGLKVIKFEKDYKSSLTYEFIGAYPISITSMPISYESSNLLKCTVSMTYIRYVMPESNAPKDPKSVASTTPQEQANLNNYNFANNETFQNPQFTVGGVPELTANSSGNTVMDPNRPTLAQIYDNIGG